MNTPVCLDSFRTSPAIPRSRTSRPAERKPELPHGNDHCTAKEHDPASWHRPSTVTVFLSSIHQSSQEANAGHSIQWVPEVNKYWWGSAGFAAPLAFGQVLEDVRDAVDGERGRDVRRHMWQSPNGRLHGYPQEHHRRSQRSSPIPEPPFGTLLFLCSRTLCHKAGLTSRSASGCPTKPMEKVSPRYPAAKTE